LLLRRGEETTMTRIESIHVVPTTPRQSAPSRFDAALQNAADHLARGVAGGLALAAPAIPGGTFLLGAVRAATQPAPGSAPVAGAAPFLGAGASGAAGLVAPGLASLPPAGAGATNVAGASAEGDVMASARALQAESQAFNAQYLQLQEAMQRENREFTAVSNVLKVKHDTARAAIGNIH
jgi:hypothetical protein